MVVLAPVLSAAGFYRHPFQTTAEKTIELALDEQDEIIRGRIDLIVINQSLGVAVIESKGKKLEQSIIRQLLPPYNQCVAQGD